MKSESVYIEDYYDMKNVVSTTTEQDKPGNQNISWPGLL